MNPTVIRETLNNALSKLNPEGAWPVNLHRILPRLGLNLRFEQKTGTAESHLKLEDPPAIVVYRQSPDFLLTAKERFSIAHELAHWVVWRRFGFLPSAQTYWDHETLCNEFAAELLMPTRAMHHFLDRLYKDQIHPVYFPEKVKKSAAVSWEAAAKRISAVCPEDLAYLQLIKLPPKNSKTDGGQEPIIFKVKCSSISNKPGSFVGQQAFLRAHDELLKWMDALPTRSFKRRETALSSGNLRLRNVFCAFLRNHNHWVINFCPSSEGINIEERMQRNPHSVLNVTT